MWLLCPFLFFCLAAKPDVSQRNNVQTCRGPLKPKSVCILFIFVFLGFRFGEASHPGPARTDSDFCIGCFNPSGLTGKAQIINESLSFADLWAVSETHLSTRSLSMFRKSLRMSKSQFSHCVAGAPVPLRIGSQLSGGWKGVAALAKHPTRAVPADMSEEVRWSSRALITATFLKDMWITMGTIYGESAGTWHPNQLANNDKLLREVATQICALSSGLRVVAGDFNNGEFDIPAFQILAMHGFKDIQTIASERWGIDMQMTCKCSTRVDYCYISPELQALLTDVQIDQTVWPDHAVLSAIFHGGVRSIPRYVWRTPQSMQWPEYAVDPIGPIQPGHATAKYAEMWQHAEQKAVAASLKPVRAACLGRASTLAPKRLLGQAHAPLRAAREGDIVPQFFGTSLQHALWYRQARRIQAFCRFAQAARNAKDPSHAAQVWGSVVRAKGFEPTFPAWWAALDHRAPGAPAVFPLVPPPYETVRSIYDTFVIALRVLERTLKANSRAYAKVRRLQSPDLVFQDIKQIGPDSVDLLIRPERVNIVEIDVDQMCLQLSRAPCWDLSKPVYCGAVELAIIHHEDCWIWVESLDGIAPGQTCTQTRFTGDLDELFHAFQTSWKQRWCRHDQVPDSQWNDILAFAATVVRPAPCRYVEVDQHLLGLEIRRKKRRTPKGLDGVSLADLQAAPATLRANICRFYQHATETGEWPSQMIAGRIANLAKHCSPMTPDDFRPITVFGLCYRLWTSIQCRSLLADLDCILPVGLFGNRKGCFPAQLWTQLMWHIETAQHNSEPCSGVMADIVKAFNTLPRGVVAATSRLLGIPEPVIRAWHGAVNSAQRYFQIRTSFSGPTPSCTGYAEGDGLSIIVMMSVNFLFHKWFEAQQVPIQPLSFVDDWQLIVKHHVDVQFAMTQLQKFCTMVDLQLDAKKTFVWSLTTSGRKHLRDLGLRVEKQCRTLGAHLGLTGRHTNATLQQRTLKLQEMWNSLRLSPSPYRTKVRAILTCAWPKGLYGVAATTLSHQTIGKLRSGAMRGLGSDASGSSPWIHLGLVETPCCDPGFWCIVQSIRCIRDCGQPEEILPSLARVAHDDVWPDNPGLTGTLLVRLQVLSWRIDHHGHVWDRFGRFCLFADNLADIVWRAEQAWQLVVGAAICHRPGLQDVGRVNAKATRRFVSKLSKEDAGMFRTILNGTHFTGEAKKYWMDDIAELCPFCGCSDSRFHRFWQCDSFISHRAQVPKDVWDLIPTLPETLTCYGWTMQPASWTDWWTTLSQPVPCPSFASPLDCHDRCLDLFTDGSCLWPKHEYSLAAWAVVQATASDAPLVCQKSHVIAAGHVGGLTQTAYRAELTGVCEAIRFARRVRRPVRIWCDCQGVVTGLQGLLNKTRRVRSSGKHADLWNTIADLIADYSPGDLTITKVAAHQDVLNTVCGFEEWCFLHNSLADSAAQIANTQRSAKFWRLHDTFKQQVDEEAKKAHAIQRVLLSISRAVLFQSTTKPDESIEPESFHCTRDAEACPTPWQGIPEVAGCPSTLVDRFGLRVVTSICNWFF